MNSRVVVVALLLAAITCTHSNSLYTKLSDIYVTNLQLTKCDSSHVDPLSVEDVTVEVQKNNHMHISGTLKAYENLTAPIEASVTLKKKVFFGWIPIPCEDNMGSCDYRDLCSYGYPADHECPPDFIENKIPCRCPILEGNYTLPPTIFEFKDDRSVLTGKYKGNIYVSHGNERLACYNMNFVLQEK